MTNIFTKLKHYFFAPRFHFSRFQFNLISLFLVSVGLVAGTYLTLSKVFPDVFALNDSNTTWTFNTANASSYTYDSTLVAVDTSAHPISTVNKFTNPAFASDVSSWSTAAVPPSGWVEVPGNSTYSTTNFLAMKYEAKCAATSDPTTGLTAPDTSSVHTYTDSTTACTSANSKQVVSVASGYPIANVSQTNATTRCSTVSVGSSSAHLITNNEWMTTARDAEAQAGNWSLGSVGSGYLYAGHNDNAPALAVVASTTDTGNNACAYTDTAGTTEAPSSCPANTANNTSGTAGNQKRVLTLSNGAYIWDIPGNVWEWTNDTIQRKDQPLAWNGTTNVENAWGWSDYATGSTATYLKNYKSGSSLQQVNAEPAGSYAHNGTFGIGRIYHYSSSTDVDTTVYAFLRGGNWNSTSYAGAFTADLNSTPGIRRLATLAFVAPVIP